MPGQGISEKVKVTISDTNDEKCSRCGHARHKAECLRIVDEKTGNRCMCL